MTTQTKTTWREVKLGEIADINMGQSPQSQFYNLDGDGLPFFQGVTEFGEMFPKIKQWTSKVTKVAEPGDILFSVRAPVGRVNYSKEKICIGRGLASMRSKEKLLNQNYLFYLLKNEENNLISQSGGSIYDSINKDKLNDFDVSIPTVDTQKQIADVLSTYDDLIENNTKRIKILEQIAQAIYKEWFLYFRFPGHENAKMIDSKTEFGKIPEGWKIGQLSNLAKITMGQSPSSDFYNEIGEGSPFHQGVTNFEFRFPVTTTYSTEGTRKATTGDILFSVRAPVGRINVADRNMIIGRGLAALKSVSGHQSFLLYNLKHLFQTEDLIGGGAIFASVTKNDLSNFPVIIPDTKMIEQFELNVRPVDQLILNTSHNISVLRNSRDLLLPKLVGGEVVVK